ncbi:MAG TPA: hypothetical protein VGJ62_05295 [Gemmatimonadaceae bacterium]|jgi:hypothetical protein
MVENCNCARSSPVRATSRGKFGHGKAERSSARSRALAEVAHCTGGAARRGSYGISGKEGEGVLVSSASRSKRLAIEIPTPYRFSRSERGSQRVSELAAEEDALARLTGDGLRNASG